MPTPPPRQVVQGKALDGAGLADLIQRVVEGLNERDIPTGRLMHGCVCLMHSSALAGPPWQQALAGSAVVGGPAALLRLLVHLPPSCSTCLAPTPRCLAPAYSRQPGGVL